MYAGGPLYSLQPAHGPALSAAGAHLLNVVLTGRDNDELEKLAQLLNGLDSARHEVDLESWARRAGQVCTAGGEREDGTWILSRPLRADAPRP